MCRGICPTSLVFSNYLGDAILRSDFVWFNAVHFIALSFAMAMIVWFYFSDMAIQHIILGDYLSHHIFLNISKAPAMAAKPSSPSVSITSS